LFDNSIWLFGGSDGKTNQTYYNDIWNTSNGRNWVRIRQTTSWTERILYAAVVDDKRMWLIGGNYDQNIFYSTNGSNWKYINVSVPTNSQSRWEFTAVYFNNKIWILGGYDNTGNFNDVWYW